MSRAAPVMSSIAGAPASAGPMAQITDVEFVRLRDWLKGAAGIHLGAAKRTLVTSRLAKRLRETGCTTFTDYQRLIDTGGDERQIAIDLLTTNETYFFREPGHFEFLAELLPTLPPQRVVRVWSAACSSGEEPYSVAMLLASQLRMRPWEVVATDISTRMLDAARTGLFRMERAARIPAALRSEYCLRGTGQYEGMLLVARSLRERVQFAHANLTGPLPDVGEFDVIFLRNVMIYFDTETKRRVVEQLITRLRPGGHLVIGHSESLNDVTRLVHSLAPSIYVRA